MKFIQLIIKAAALSPRHHTASITHNICLLLPAQILAVYSGNKKIIATVYEFLNVKVGGTYSYQCDLKG
jgi:hypothetical protein